MKKVVIPTMLVAVLIAATLLSGCSVPRLGGVVTLKKDFTGFTQVDVGGSFEVEIVKSNSFSITVSADKSLSDYIAVSKDGETLKIYLNPRHLFTDFSLEAKTLKAKITMPTLSGLHLYGATKATVTGFKSPENFNLSVSGASSLDIDDIEVGNAEVEISGASKVTGKMKTGDIKLQVSGASRVELKGSANNTALNNSGASRVNLADFPVSNSNVVLSGASEATLKVEEKLDAVLSDASRLYFTGNPTIGNVSISGASTIKHR